MFPHLDEIILKRRNVRVKLHAVAKFDFFLVVWNLSLFLDGKFLGTTSTKNFRFVSASVLIFLKFTSDLFRNEPQNGILV